MKDTSTKKGQKADLKITPEEIIIRQNRVIISLLARQTLGEKELSKIVTKRKKDPKAYLKGYNACDGTKSVSDLAKVVDVTPGTLSPIFQDWEGKSIIYDVGSPGRPLYVKLMALEE